MKKASLIFVLEFAALFVVFYFFLNDRDLGRSLFVSIFVAAFSALLNKFFMRLVVEGVKKVVKNKTSI
jgi:hypothetical protein